MMVLFGIISLCFLVVIGLIFGFSGNGSNYVVDDMYPPSSQAQGGEV